MSSSWYFVKDGQRNGPMGREELDARIAEGAVQGDTLVWRPGMSAWAKAHAVAELGLPPPPPPLMPPPLPPRAGFVPRVNVDADGEAATATFASDSDVRAKVAVPAQHFAGFWVRFAAKLIDVALLSGVGQGVEWAVKRWVFEGDLPVPPDWAGFLRSMAWMMLIGTLVGMAYTVYFQTKYEGTPGKLLLGLRVVRADGSRLGAGKSMGRYWAEQLTGFTFLAGYVMAAFDEERRAFHDFVCNTRVVKGRREEGR